MHERRSLLSLTYVLYGTNVLLFFHVRGKNTEVPARVASNLRARIGYGVEHNYFTYQST